MITITTHWLNLGHGNKIDRNLTIQELCEEIKVFWTVSQEPYLFLQHEENRLSTNRKTLEIYYTALDALNKNINMLVKNQTSHCYMQIYALLKLISNTLVVKIPPIPQLVRQYNSPGPSPKPKHKHKLRPRLNTDPDFEQEFTEIM